MPQNTRFSLARNSSTGRPVWWIDHGISSSRAEIFLRRKMAYLQEQRDNADRDTIIIVPVISTVHNCSGVNIDGERKIMKDPSSELDCLDTTTLIESELSTISHSQNENGMEKIEAFIDNMAKSLSAAKPQSPKEGCNDAKQYLQAKKMNDVNGLAHEISVEDQHSILEPTISIFNNIDQTLLPSLHHHHLPNDIPTVQLSSGTANQQRTYLDFGEDNIVGKLTRQYFHIFAPTEDECNGSGQEFYIQFQQSLPERGIMCTCCHYSTTKDSLIPSCNENNVISLRMKQGESTTIQVMWNPINDGCIRVKVDFEVRNRIGIYWNQSLVLVGEAHRDAVDENELNDKVVVRKNFAESNNDGMVDKHMVSDITDTVYYSRDEITLENISAVHYGDDVSLEDELHRYHDHVVDAIKADDDSMACSQETNGSQPKTGNETCAQKMTLWNVNLSVIKEISDNDTRETLNLHSDFGGQVEPKANEISASLESGGSVLGQRAKIGETDKFVDISTIRSSEPSNYTVQGDTSTMFHHLVVLPDEPHDDGRSRKTNGETTRTHFAEDDLTEQHQVSKAEKMTELAIDLSTEALKLKQVMGYRIENCEKEQLLILEEGERTRMTVDQEYKLLQSRQINDFEDLLVSEGLVEGGMALVDDDTSNQQIELAVDINSSLVNFVENMRPKSPSFGSLSSKDSIDDNNSLPSTSRALLLSSSIAEAQENLDPMDDKSEYFGLQSQSEKLVRTHSIHFDDEDESTISLVQMMEQTSNSDNSYEEELGNAKSELNAVIDKISELEVDIQIQHEYITSPSNLDLYTQLVNLNDHANGTTPLSINRISDPTGFFQRTEEGNRPLCNNDKPSRESSSTAKIGMAAQKKSLAEQSNSATQERSESTQYEVYSEPILKMSTQRQPESEQGTPKNEHDKNLLSIAPGDTFKTPHNSRLEKIASIRDKLSLIKIEDTFSNGSTPNSADCTNHLTVSAAVAPRGILMVNDLPNSTKTSARRCYFYTSPARHDTRTKLSHTDIYSQRKQLPDEKSAKKCNMKESDLHPQQKSNKQGKNTVSLSHLLRPREVQAHEKHVQSMRELKNKGNCSPNPIRERNRTSLLVTTAPSPRELKAYEKHIRSMRERLNRAGMMYSCPDVLISSGKNTSPATRPMQRIGGVDSPSERGRWSG